ncbi:hypothetical protein HIF96_01365 [Helcococcus kunzii]|uniref:DsbA family protein n=1 Tax=Helcococcus kunzii TaxID=40091 RepID=UPI001BAE8EBA|nr:DsbA family protein [Helcococcus kunzii]QUY64249.1 hypothetical protein GUI37_01435 [Helcococcus kunzii]QZO76705.1 hypothetical protein HIF96_01365 [Helcococcus kunzii]
MKKIIKISLIFVLLFALSACSNNKETEQESTKESSEEKIKINEIDKSEYKNIENGGFFVNNKGVVVDKKDTQGYKIVEWYFDPLCPSCMQIEEKTSPYLFGIMGKKTLINYKPLTFLGRPKNDDPKNPAITYSDVMSSIILSMAENDPELVSKYIVKVVNKNFVDSISKLNDTEKQNEAMKNVYTKDLSGTKWDKIKEDMDKTMITARNLTNYVKNDEELKEKTLDGSLSVPLIYVRGEEKILDIYQENMDYRPLLEEKLK